MGGLGILNGVIWLIAYALQYFLNVHSGYWLYIIVDGLLLLIVINTLVHKRALDKKVTEHIYQITEDTITSNHSDDIYHWLQIESAHESDYWIALKIENVVIPVHTVQVEQNKLDKLQQLIDRYDLRGRPAQF